MITFLLGLAVVLVIGGFVVRHAVVTTPGRTRKTRPARKSTTTSKPRKTRKPAGPTRHTGGSAAGQLVGSVLGALAQTVRKALDDTPDAERIERTRQAHEAAKKAGMTAATRTTQVVVDRRTWREAMTDLVDAWTGRTHDRSGDDQDGQPESPPDPEPAAQVPDPQPAPPAPAPDAPATTPDAPPKGKIYVPTYLTLFEAGDRIAAQPFEHIFVIESFIKGIHSGSTGTANMYFSLAERMSGPMSVDRIVTEPIGTCGMHQRVIGGLVQDADVNLSMILSGTTQQLLEKGIRIPKPELLNNGASVMAGAVVPEFFEIVHTVAGRTYGDIREVHCLLKALGAASYQQAVMYRAVAQRLLDENIDATVAEKFTEAAGHQDSITTLMAEADTAMTRLLNMTVRELAASSLRAPNANLLNV